MASTYTCKCHCGEVEWEVKAEPNHVLWCGILRGWPRRTLLTAGSHCNTCKQLSGGAFTLNQIVPKDDIKVTKGTLKNYTYKGDSGES